MKLVIDSLGPTDCVVSTTGVGRLFSSGSLRIQQNGLLPRRALSKLLCIE
jgi:hypothetical protein